MWIVGDSKGYNSFYHDGELIDRTNTNIWPILTIVSSSQQLVAIGKQRIGVFNTAYIEFTVLLNEDYLYL